MSVLYEVSEHIATITLDRAEKKNALTVKMYQELRAHLARADADDDVRVIVWRSNGDAFTAGNDLRDFMDTPPAGPESPVFHVLIALLELKKPLVAAVHGAAVGIGTTGLLHCDLVFAREDARLSMPFVNLGLCPEAASSLLLPRLAGLQKAGELLMYGEPFDAKTAERIGLVNEVLPIAGFHDEVRARAKKLAEKPAASLRATKELLRGPMREEVREAMLREGEVFVERVSSPEAIEAFTAFFEKRPPDFTRFS